MNRLNDAYFGPHGVNKTIQIFIPKAFRNSLFECRTEKKKLTN